MAPLFIKKGALVIDNSSAFRMDEEVPLVVPEVNGSILKKCSSRIIANPNCSTIQLVPFLDIVEQLCGIESVFVSTYQSVSGAGKGGIEELRNQITALFSGKTAVQKVFPQRIAFNLIPQIGPFYPEGYCEEEVKMINETRKILSIENLDIDVTTVRVPTFFSHAETVVVNTKKSCSLEMLRKKINENFEMTLMDDPEELFYPTLVDSSGKNEVFIGRLRNGRNNDKRVSAWIVADNVRKGAAYNAIRIAETVIGGLNE
jgi:aspartate-semialdehyde dehydrogenase